MTDDEIERLKKRKRTLSISDNFYRKLRRASRPAEHQECKYQYNKVLKDLLKKFYNYSERLLICFRPNLDAFDRKYNRDHAEDFEGYYFVAGEDFWRVRIVQDTFDEHIHLAADDVVLMNDVHYYLKGLIPPG